MPKSIVDWFDINNPEHIAAYQFVCDKGYWPEGFIPSKKAVAFPAGWPVLLAGTIAEQLLAQRTKNDEVFAYAEGVLDGAVGSEGSIQTEFVQIRRDTATQLLASVKRVLDPRRVQR